MVASLIANRALNAARISSRSTSVRSISSSASQSKDFVQEAYLRELKAYKPPAKAADAHKGQVREFSSPKAPSAPSAPSSSDLSSQLSEYSSSEPDLAEKVLASSEGSSSSSSGDVKAYLEEAVRPVEKEHH